MNNIQNTKPDSPWGISALFSSKDQFSQTSVALSLLFLFDLGEPVPTYRWNLKLRSSSLVVNENHRAFTVRAGFHLQHHRHISLGTKAFWGCFGRPLLSGLSRLPLPQTSALQTASRELSLSQPPTSLGRLHWAGAWVFNETSEKSYFYADA